MTTITTITITTITITISLSHHHYHHHHATQTEYAVSLNADDRVDGHLPTISVRARQQSGATKISTFNQWARTWNEFFQASAFFHPHLVTPMIQYQANIARFASVYPRTAWMSYDAAFRQSVANNPSLSWSSINDELFNRFLRTAQLLPTTTRATRTDSPGDSSGSSRPGLAARNQCYTCREFGHLARVCPYRAHSVGTATTGSQSIRQAPQVTFTQASTTPTMPNSMPAFRAPQRQRWCYAFNEGRLCQPNCQWPHVCAKCSGAHPVSACNN